MDVKLIQAHAEIAALLRKHDIAAHVVLHNAPGESEVFMRLTPSYSRLVEQAVSHEGVVYRLRSKLVEDYGGDREAQVRDMAATANMVCSLATHLGEAALSMRSLAQHIDQLVGAKHTEFYSTDGTAQ